MEIDATRGSVWKTMGRFALPYLCSYFLQTLYGMADLFIIGCLGDEQLSQPSCLGRTYPGSPRYYAHLYPQTRAAEESGSFLEQDSTAVPNFAYRSFCPCGNLVGECLPQTLLWRLKPLEKFPQILFGLFQKQFRYTPRFSPISERTPRTERRSTTYETI